MRPSNLSKITDAATQILAVGLAVGCVVFAGYKVVKLGNMEDPPADLGLNFPEPKRKVITEDSILVDPMTTESTVPPSRDIDNGRRILQPYTNDAPIQEYRLLTVIDGVAFVEVLTLRGKEILPMVTGTRLPGAGPVDRIVRVGGRWMLVAGDVELVAER
jgi:hypothetical protein